MFFVANCVEPVSPVHAKGLAVAWFNLGETMDQLIPDTPGIALMCILRVLVNRLGFIYVLWPGLIFGSFNLPTRLNVVKYQRLLSFPFLFPFFGCCPP
jgi:hypothetical protein